MKHPTWHQRLTELIDERKREPFQWGVNDCCLWAADAVRVQTGVDHAADLRGRYKTASGAARVLKRIGGLPGAAARAGAEVGRLFAQTGDIGLVQTSANDVLGVCIGALWVVVIDTGLGFVDYDMASRVWRVA